MKNNKAFSLIELAIVITIIGILVAGVSATQKLLDQSKQRGVVRQAENYRTAIATFRLTYKTLPGDMIDAASYWSACTDESGNTCNGDGDGNIETIGDVSYESYRAWQHLSLADVIKESYTGLGSSSTIGINVAKSPYSDTCFNFNYLSSRNGLMLGGISVACDGTTLTTRQAYHIDQKADDGNSITGSIYGLTSGCSSASGVYTLLTTTPVCYLQFSIIE